jgi:hypothetical protein
VRFFFLLAALDDLNVAACNIQGAYLTADCREKIYIILQALSSVLKQALS